LEKVEAGVRYRGGVLIEAARYITTAARRKLKQKVKKIAGIIRKADLISAFAMHVAQLIDE